MKRKVNLNFNGIQERQKRKKGRMAKRKSNVQGKKKKNDVKKKGHREGGPTGESKESKKEKKGCTRCPRLNWRHLGEKTKSILGQ